MWVKNVLFSKARRGFGLLAFRLVRCEAIPGPTKGGEAVGRTSEERAEEKQPMAPTEARNRNEQSVWLQSKSPEVNRRGPKPQDKWGGFRRGAFQVLRKRSASKGLLFRNGLKRKKLNISLSSFVE